MPLETSRTDKREIVARFPLTTIDTEQLGKWLAHAGQDGYILDGAATLEGGNQRDPHTVGVRLTAVKP